ncbi:MAG: SMC-Scp complex subunit ScpB, partial [Myxococcales bacterium]
MPLAQAVNVLAERERQQLEEPIPETIKADDASDEELEDDTVADIDQPPEETDESFDKLVSKAKKLTPDRVRPILEALLFVSDKPLPDEAIRQCTGLELPVIRQQMEKLQGHYRDGIRGIVLTEVAGGWQFRTDSSVAEHVRRFLKVKPQRLTRAALETLAIIAYRQPVTRPEIEEIRACDCGAVIKALLDRKLVKIIGKKEEVGRPLLYGTTKEFLEFFNLKDLASLPTLREFHELSEEHQEIVEKETGPRPTVKGTVAALRDTEFEARLQAASAEGDAALADLETAMAVAEEKTKGASAILNPKPPPPEP